MTWRAPLPRLPRWRQGSFCNSQRSAALACALSRVAGFAVDVAVHPHGDTKGLGAGKAPTSLQVTFNTSTSAAIACQATPTLATASAIVR